MKNLNSYTKDRKGQKKLIYNNRFNFEKKRNRILK